MFRLMIKPMLSTMLYPMIIDDSPAGTAWVDSASWIDSALWID